MTESDDEKGWEKRRLKEAKYMSINGTVIADH